MVRWVVGSILHDGPIELFLVPVTGVTKAEVCVMWYVLCGMCYPVYGMMYIKEPLLLCGVCDFPLSLSEWSFAYV